MKKNDPAHDVMRGIYVPWHLALRGGEEGGTRVLRDLRRFTDVDTVILLDLYLERVKKGSTKSPYVNSRAAVRADSGLSPSIRGVSDTTLARMNQFMRTARSQEFKIACLTAPLFVCGGEKSMGCVDFSGRTPSALKSDVSYGCPNNPLVMAYGQGLLRGIIDAWRDLDYLLIDHLEYPVNIFVSYPRVDLRDLLVCFCQSCGARASKEGVDLERVRGDLASLHESISTRRRATPPKIGPRRQFGPSDILDLVLEHPQLTTWLDFRTSSMTTYAMRLLEALPRDAVPAKNSAPLKFGFYFQMPTVSRLVGTDYEGLLPYFDFGCVKLPDYIPGSVLPLVAAKISEDTRWIDGGAALSFMRELLDLGPGPETYRPTGGLKDVLLYSNATDPSMIDRQMARMKRILARKAIIPHVWEHNGNVEGLKEKMDALEKYELPGYSIWAFDDGLTPDRLRAAGGVL